LDECAVPVKTIDAKITSLFNLPVTPVEDTARKLYKIGLNVFPVPYAQKGGAPWKPLMFTRMHPKYLSKVFDGRCNLAIMCGSTSGNLFVLDCETAAVFAEQGKQLKSRGIPVFAVRSGGGRGGGHYYLRCIEGEVANMPRGVLKDLEIRGCRGYVLAPPSVHPDTGALYQWDVRETAEPPLVHLADIDWLRLTLDAKCGKSRWSQPDEYSQLSFRTRSFLSSGAPEGERNNRLFAAACDMAGVGFDFTLAKQLLARSAESCGLGRREIWDTLHSAYNRPRDPARPVQPAPPAHTWQKARAWADQQYWKGLVGQTDRAVFLACCERARVNANEDGVFRASIREVAELAQVNKNTAAASLKRFIASAHLIFCGENDASGARLFCFGPFLRDWDTAALPVGDTVPILPFPLSLDAFETGALGKTAGVVWQKLLEIGTRLLPKEIAAACRLSIDQVYRAMKRLCRFGLAYKESHCWAAVPADRAWLDKNVAEPLGTLGRGQRRRALHRDDRALRAGKLVLAARRADRRAQRMMQKRVVLPVQMSLRL
jgi:hypothetical protein